MVGGWWETGEDSVQASARPTGLSQVSLSLLVIASNLCVMQRYFPPFEIGILGPRRDFIEAATIVRFVLLNYCTCNKPEWDTLVGTGMDIKDHQHFPL